MPRVARVVAPGVPHHVTQRGNNRQEVFFADDDRRFYLQALAEQAERFDLRLLGYCLMTNHVHLVVVPEREESLAKAVGRTHWLYTQAVNRLHGRSGHLWQNRFHSCPLDSAHTWAALRYVERNPVRAKLVRRAWRYTWSSAAAHVAGADASGLLDMAGWEEGCGAADWRAELTRGVREAGRPHAGACSYVRTRTGRPLGSDSFMSKLESTLGRRLRALPIGRPRKRAAKQAERKRSNR